MFFGKDLNIIMIKQNGGGQTTRWGAMLNQSSHYVDLMSCQI